MSQPIPGLPVSDDYSGAVLLNRYRNNQQAIGNRVVQAIQSLWARMVNPASFNDSWRMLGPLVNGIVSTHYEASAADAAQYYANSRVISGNPYMAVPGQNPDDAYIAKVTGMMGPGQFFHFLKDQEPDTASGMASDALSGASARLVLMGGRDTVTNAAQLDPEARGWERVIEPGACGFCAMLAGRGAVYKESTVDFRAHDHCHCVARAVFRGQPSVNSGLREAWGTATKGTSGKAAIAAWNDYWEKQNGTNVAASGTPATEAAAS